MPKEPKLVTCTFLQAWRGHAAGAVAALTPERAEELLEDGIVVQGEKKLAKPTKTAKGDAEETTTTTTEGEQAGGDPPAAGNKPKGGRKPKA